MKPIGEFAPHQLRVVDERDELAVKLQKLKTFIENPIFAKLPDAEQSRLRCQLAVMTAYVEILTARIVHS